jgi:hypothetical protein
MLIQSNAFAAFTFDWDGGTSTSWTTTSNWTISGSTTTGTAATYPGSSTLRTDDIIRFGVNLLPLFLSQPTLTLTAGQSLTVASITFGPNQYISTNGLLFNGTTLTVNVGTLIVTGSIIQNFNNNAVINSTINNFLLGTGTINCSSIQVGSGSSSTTNYNFLFSEVKNLTVSGNVTVIMNTAQQNGCAFRLQAGSMSIGGVIGFTTVSGVNSNNAGYFTIDALNSAGVKSSPTLTLSNANALGAGPSLPQNGTFNKASINFNGTSTSGGKITVIYTGATPTIYTSSLKGFGPGGGTITSGANYDNLIINGTGTANIGLAAVAGVLKTDSALTTSSNTTFANATTTTTVGTNWQNDATATITFGAGATSIVGSLNNDGAMNMASGNIGIGVNYTNTGTFTASTGLVTFNGSGAQILTDVTPAGTNFNNVTFTNGTVLLTKTMSAGSKFTVAPTYTLNVNSAAILTVGSDPIAQTTALTMLSTSAGDASIGDLTNGTITGSINVNRYVTGGLRRYMLLSSPVNNATVSTFNLIPLKATTFITGPSGSTNGFDNAPTTGNNPSVFMYDENAPTASDPNRVAGNDFKPFATINETVPLGNGLLYYFRGSRSLVNPFVRPFPASDNTTLNFFGTVKSTSPSGQFTVNVVAFPSSAPTNYTTSGTTTSTNLSFASTTLSKKGFNLIGNPFASTIDLKKVYSVNLAINAAYIYKFYYMLVRNASTGTNSSSTKYAVYDATSAAVPPLGANQYALSGQGFFVAASGATPIVFNETMKVPYSSYTSSSHTLPVFNVKKNNPSLTNLTAPPYENSLQRSFANAADNSTPTTSAVPTIRLELNKDSSVFNSTDISFVKNNNKNFVPGEDAPFLQASGQGDLLYSMSADSIGCFVNYTSDLEKIKRLNLTVTFSGYGLYKITSPIKQNIDSRYTIYLKDKYKSDSLDMVQNSEYSFTVDNNTASYAHDRFYLSIGISPGHDYKLLSFAGNKVTSGIQLTWKTDNESNFTRFVVEKSTNNGTSFIAIDSLQSTGGGSYTFTDRAPGTGQIIYRLVQALVTGNTDISKKLTFNSLEKTPSKFLVYPTYTTQNININFGKTYSNRIKVRIMGSTGNIAKTLTVTNTDLVHQDVGNLITGLYIVEAVDEATGMLIGSAKFFKQ